jgi:hypothetical protein
MLSWSKPTSSTRSAAASVTVAEVSPGLGRHRHVEILEPARQVAPEHHLGQLGVAGPEPLDPDQPAEVDRLGSGERGQLDHPADHVGRGGDQR